MNLMLKNALNQEVAFGVLLFFTIGGLLFDLFIGFFLVWKRTVYIAVIVSCLFHLSNHFIFSSGSNAVIGIFPFFMIGTSLFFLPAEFFQRKFKMKTYDLSNIQLSYSKKLKKTIAFVIIIHFTIQLVLPVRHYFIPGYVDWTSEGHYFAWRMKIRHKEGKINLDIKDGVTGERTFVALKSFLNLNYALGVK